MEKYKRFTKEVTTDDEIQKIFDRVTTEGWEIIYYNESPIGGMGIIKITIVGKKISKQSGGLFG